MRQKLLFLFFGILFFNYSNAQIVANTPSFYTFCEYNSDGYAEFDLESKTAEVIGNQDPTNLVVTYHFSQADANTGINPLTSPYTNVFLNQQIFVRLTDTLSGDFDTTDFYINTGNIPDVGAPRIQEVCDDGNQDEIAVFDLTQNDIWFSGDPNFVTSYYLTQIDAQNHTNPVNASSFVNTENPQTLFVRVEDPPTLCHDFSTLTVRVNPNPTPSVNVPDLQVCDDNSDGISVFDLTVNEAAIVNGEVGLTVSYYTSEDFAIIETNVISNPSLYQNTSNPQTVFARVENSVTGCFSVTNFDISVNEVGVNTNDSEALVCDFDNDGFAEFYLSDYDGLVSNFNPNVSVSYYESEADALQTTNVLTSPYTNTNQYNQVLFVRVENLNTGCVGFTSLYLNVINMPIPNNPTPLVVCDDDGDGFAEFNLESKNAEIIDGNDPNNAYVSYHETQADADNGVNAIASPYTNVVTNFQTLYVRVTDFIGDCYNASVTLDLVVDASCIQAIPSAIDVCSSDPNYVGNFDLTSQETVILNGQSATDFTVSYYETYLDADGGVNEISNPTDFTNNFNPQITYVRVTENATNDYAVATLTLNVYLTIDTTENHSICNGESLVLSTNINNPNATYQWNTGEFTPEIVVNFGGDYVVVIEQSGCTSTMTFTVDETAINAFSPADLTNCNGNSVFDLTSTSAEILSGIDPNTVQLTFYTSLQEADSGINSIVNPESYTSINPQTIYARVSSLMSGCYNLVDFNLNFEDCPTEFDCGEAPINFNYCYEDDDTNQFIYASVDGSPISVVFNAGQVEVNYDALIVLDSNGINLNADNPYGNNGDVSGLSFASAGTLTIYVDSDGSINCNENNYTPLDYTISCIDVTEVPNCDSVLVTPLDGDTEVDENVELTWTSATVLVAGYKVSLGITPGGTEVLDAEDVGGVLSHDVGTLDYATTYYVTITPYNDNGDAINCTEESFTTRDDPNVIINCADAQPYNTNYCYSSEDTTQFNFTSSDGLPLLVVFNAGQVEEDYDALIVLDSDGTNLNIDNPYGNNGDVSGLSFETTGSSITIYVDSDNIIACDGGNYTPLDFDVFCSDSVGIINVDAFIDGNTNSVFDANEFNYTNGYFTYEVNNDGVVNTVSSSTGNFNIISTNDTDSYTINYYLYDEYSSCYTIATSTFNAISVTAGNTVDVEFPVVEQQSCEDLAVYLINYSAPPRPGFTHSNYLVLENYGLSTITSGTVEFVTDNLLVFNNASSTNPNYTITNTATGFTVDFVDLLPGTSEYIYISLTCPATVNLGDIVTNTTTYLTDANDNYAGNNYSTLSEVVVGSWDPNDKLESHGPKVVYDDFTASDEYLYYTIRFQNLGTADAITVRIEDALDSQLDETTFQMLSSKHDYVVTRVDNQLTWQFDNINLPAEQDDASGSQGYVYFKIKPKAGYAIGDIIPNTAAIYFDFNAPVITNRFDTEFVENALSVSEFAFNNLQLQPNPAKDIVNIRFSSIISGNLNVSIYDIQGKLITTQLFSETDNIQLNVSDFESGMYFIKLKNNRLETTRKLIKG